MSKTKKEEQIIEETKNASTQLDMWAKALGLSNEDIKNIKIGAVQDLVKEAKDEEGKATEESDTSKLIEKLSSGEFGFSTVSSACVPSPGGSCSTLSTILPYMMLLSSLHSYSAPPPITVHVHIDK